MIKVGKFWGGSIGFDGTKLTSSRYPKNDRIIQHYGNDNYCNPNVQKILRAYNQGETNPYEYYLFYKFILKIKIKKIIKLLFNIIFKKFE